jgi:hypothetical protein
MQLKVTPLTLVHFALGSLQFSRLRAGNWVFFSASSLGYFPCSLRIR